MLHPSAISCSDVQNGSTRYIDEYDVVVTGWKRRDQTERLTPPAKVRAVRAKLKPDEYITKEGRLKVHSYVFHQSHRLPISTLSLAQHLHTTTRLL